MANVLFRPEPPSAAMALRDSYGDRKIPDISRKITACVACRKRKVKCHIDEAGPPCSRCKLRGLSCTVNKSIQMLLENDLTWKEVIEKRIDALEQKEQAPRRPNSTRDAFNDFSNVRRPTDEPLDDRVSRIVQPTTLDSQTTTVQAGGDGLNLSCSLGAFPASSTVQTKADGPNLPTHITSDLISRGVLNLESAQNHHAFFITNLNSIIYDILDPQVQLTDLRSKSSLLTGAICTTAAYCSGSPDYQDCLDAFKAEVASKLFSDDYTFNDVRALCIVAFWISEISTALNALAVRVAAQLNLHRCITKIPFVKRECYERTRLYLLVFVCDHQCSLNYGRPPLTHEFKRLKNAKYFLQSQFSSPIDLKLLSHVELWSINSRVLDMYGADIENPSISANHAAIEEFKISYEKWNQEWMQVMSLMLDPRSFSQTLFDLYYCSAKLCLFSHIFRGPAQRQPKPPTDAHGLDKLAQNAGESALSMIQTVIQDADIQTWLTCLPCYLTSTVGFACVVLLRMRSQNRYGLNQETVSQQLQLLCDLLHGTSALRHPSNSLAKVANSLTSVAPPPHPSNDLSLADDVKMQALDTGINFDAEIFDIGLFELDEHWLESHVVSG